MRIKRRKRLASRTRVRPAAASRVNDRRSIDFVADSLSGGGKSRVSTVIDRFTRECLAVKIARRLPSRVVPAVLDKVIAIRGRPRTIQVDNGSEFTSNHFDAWAYCNGIEVDFIRPGKPVDNANIEAFNGRLRDECLNARWLESADDARQALPAWRRDYNQVRPHSSLGICHQRCLQRRSRVMCPSCAHSPETRSARLDQPGSQARPRFDSAVPMARSSGGARAGSMACRPVAGAAGRQELPSVDLGLCQTACCVGKLGVGPHSCGPRGSGSSDGGTEYVRPHELVESPRRQLFILGRNRQRRARPEQLLRVVGVGELAIAFVRSRLAPSAHADFQGVKIPALATPAPPSARVDCCRRRVDIQSGVSGATGETE